MHCLLTTVSLSCDNLPKPPKKVGFHEIFLRYSWQPSLLQPSCVYRVEVNRWLATFVGFTVATLQLCGVVRGCAGLCGVVRDWAQKYKSFQQLTKKSRGLKRVSDKNSNDLRRKRKKPAAYLNLNVFSQSCRKTQFIPYRAER